MREIIIKIFVISCFFTIPLFLNEALAQVPPPQPSESVPLDGGAFMLLIGGTIYGIKKLMQKNKKKGL